MFALPVFSLFCLIQNSQSERKEEETKSHNYSHRGNNLLGAGNLISKVGIFDVVRPFGVFLHSMYVLQRTRRKHYKSSVSCSEYQTRSTDEVIRGCPDGMGLLFTKQTRKQQ